MTRYEPRRIASAPLTDAERDAIARAQRTERARVEAQRRRDFAAQRAEDLERKRREAAAQGHSRLERELAASRLEHARRATRERASVGLTAEEQAQIDAAVAAGRVTRIENGDWEYERSKRRGPRHRAQSWQMSLWASMRHRS